jgi:hypothetical protein
MNIDKFLNTKAGQVVIISTVAAVGLYYIGRKASQVAAAVNPVSKDNVVYTGVNGIGEALTGKKSFDLGTWIYDKTHGIE